MMPVAKISANFQLSGRGDGFTLSFDIVIMVPANDLKNTQVKLGATGQISDLENVHFKNAFETQKMFM